METGGGLPEVFYFSFITEHKKAEMFIVYIVICFASETCNCFNTGRYRMSDLCKTCC